MNHDYSKGQMIGLAIGFMIIPIVFFGLRLWAKTLLVAITCCTLQLATAVHGHLGQHQPQNPDGSPIMDDPGLIFFEQTKFALNMISILGLGLVKSSILVLYNNIFKVRKFQLCIYAMLAFVICWTISFFFSHLFTCYPITVFIEPFYGNKCVQTVPMFFALLYTDVIADVVILVLPIPMVLSVQLPMKKKLAVIGMLALGAAVCAISITRVIATYAVANEYIKHPNDVIYYTAPVFFWTNIELSLAVVCACLPTLRPIYLHFFPKPIRETTSSYGYSSSRPMGTKKSSLGPKFSHNAYDEIEELELTSHVQNPSISPEAGIMRKVTIRQTTEASEGSSTKSLRGKSTLS
ncbi:hypothetical protein BCR34DRAFT_624866 [Clohesyomyces aquaticus]|uniref:Rhodopsin domain-containing protein n=1 Tax=Clohesyomyces aquaticus TaxID=1231657 RepID=A0A1Y1ZMA9_9PLEO|nr:hypothetical protein BCR34DRAFT_624866 [Clohesyomyces aquaticus]